MLIDKYLMKFDFNEIHQLAIRNILQQIYSIIKRIISESWIIKLLFKYKDSKGDE